MDSRLAYTKASIAYRNMAKSKIKALIETYRTHEPSQKAIDDN
jgi:hypothetical protein